MNKIVIASSNKHKIAEINVLLAPLNYVALPQSEFNIADADETGTTFIENAIIKAKHANKVSGLPALADDSGIMVEALNGAPGVYSARYAGSGKSDSENNNKLLNAMIGETNRKAKFVCVMALHFSEHHPLPLISQGLWHGEIATKIVGDFGFGYDSLFYIPELGKTVGELTTIEKSKYSHRALALNSLVKQLRLIYKTSKNK